MTVDDVIRTLNVEIFAGEGPDVLVLDGLPVESYIRQGILADLSNIDTSNCYENIVHCYADESGCWALPLLFRPSMVYCQSEENKARLSEAQNLTDLQDLLCVKSNFIMMGTTTCSASYTRRPARRSLLSKAKV